MGVFKRIKDMTKASVNDMLDKVEDPIVMLNQYLRDMEAEIHEAEVTVAKQMANERRMKQRLMRQNAHRYNVSPKLKLLCRMVRKKWHANCWKRKFILIKNRGIP